MSDIVAFCRRNLAEAREAAEKATPGPWMHDAAGQVIREAERDYRVIIPAGRDGLGLVEPADLDHIARQDPAATLRRVEALERVVEEHPNVNDGNCGTCVVGDWGYPTHGGSRQEGFPCRTLRLIASIWEDADGWDPAWTVER